MLPSGSPKARAIASRLQDVPEAAELPLAASEQAGLPPSLLQDLQPLSAASDSPYDPLIGPQAGSVPAAGGMGSSGGGGSPPRSPPRSPASAAAAGPAAGQQSSPPREGKVKRFIVSMKTAGPAFLQRAQLESQPSVAAGAAAAAPANAAQPRPLLHALTESPAVIRRYAE